MLLVYPPLCLGFILPLHLGSLYVASYSPLCHYKAPKAPSLGPVCGQLAQSSTAYSTDSLSMRIEQPEFSSTSVSSGRPCHPSRSCSRSWNPFPPESGPVCVPLQRACL
ncbi:hypothetical protein DFH06DRAFT_1231727 [Mycena polygramma]|nr:hypothetical protein DFH06DRAFT_1231727 [Mycena polygramma]